jgi:hypothetical protein
MNFRSFFVCILLFTRAYSNIEELESITHLPSRIVYSDKRTLVCFDIDNTLIRPSTHLGSEQWFGDLCNKLKLSGMSMSDILDIILPAYYAVHSDIDTEPVELETHLIVQSLAQHYPILALTRRSACMLGITLQQLTNNNLTLEAYSPVYISYAFQGIDQGAYHNGIILCGNNTKGAMLKSFLERSHYMPERIIFIDDRIEHILDVYRTCQELGIECCAFHYTYVEKNIAHTYNHDEVHEEYQALYGMPYDFINLYK